MSFRAVLMIFSALLCGASAAVGVSRMLLATPHDVEMAPVVEVAASMPRGHVIEAADVRVGQWPKGLLPSGTFTSVDQVVGRSSLGQMIAGEPVLDGKLGSKDGGRGLSALVPMGMRAYSIVASRTGMSAGVSAGLSVAGFILPGNKVDVLLNIKNSSFDGTSGGGRTTTLLQSIEVLAVDQQLDAPADNKVNPKDFVSVTLLVTPEQAAQLDLGQNLGQLALSLRNLSDNKPTNTTPALLSDIIGQNEPGKSAMGQLMQSWLSGGPAAPRRESKNPDDSKEKAKAPPEPAYYHIMAIRGTQEDHLRIPVGIER